MALPLEASLAYRAFLAVGTGDVFRASLVSRLVRGRQVKWGKLDCNDSRMSNTRWVFRLGLQLNCTSNS